jgi:neutral ceramidase
LAAAYEELSLKVRKPDQQMIERAKKVLERPDTVKTVYPHEKVYAERIIYLLDYPDQINIMLQTFKIGDLGVATTPFETFAETGLEIKEKSPFKTTFTIELANGYHGYLPTPEQHELGGYETWLGTNKVEKQASVKIVDKLLEMFDQIK